MTRRKTYKFRLYVADGVANSAEARENLAELCRVYLPGAHEVEIVDVFREPRRALADRIFMTPTLLKLGPLPAGRIVGTLSQTQPVLRALGLFDRS